MSEVLDEHFKKGVQACLRAFAKDEHLQGNFVDFVNYVDFRDIDVDFRDIDMLSHQSILSCLDLFWLTDVD